MPPSPVGCSRINLCKYNCTTVARNVNRKVRRIRKPINCQIRNKLLLLVLGNFVATKPIHSNLFSISGSFENKEKYLARLGSILAI